MKDMKDMKDMKETKNEPTLEELLEKFSINRLTELPVQSQSDRLSPMLQVIKRKHPDAYRDAFDEVYKVKPITEEMNILTLIELERLVNDQKPLAAIKTIRSLTNAGLVDSKDFVDAMLNKDPMDPRFISHDFARVLEYYEDLLPEYFV